MAKLSTLQEIILVNDTQFANRQYSEVKKPAPEKSRNYIAQHEKLKEACWNGLLRDMMPELFLHFGRDEKLYMWQMRECENMITMEMAEEPSPIDFSASIDPYCFMELQEYN